MAWEVLASEIIYRCRIFSVRRDRSRSLRSGRAFDFHVLETQDFVNVVPLTADGCVVMVRQFRHGIRDFTLEVPAGLMDESDPSPVAAAARELREETGYGAQHLLPLGVVHPNPALMNNRCHMFVAHDVAVVGAPQWDGSEELDVQTVPLARIPALVAQGAVGNALTLAAFHLLQLKEPSLFRD